MSNIAIRAENLGKRYRIGAAAERHDSLRDAIAHAVKAPFRNLDRLRSPSSSREQERDTVWALRDVSFEVKHGEVLGLVGRNGAGKSTLLKMVSRIIEPTTGRAEVYGRVGSLLEVGTGFHPELTGRDNIYLNGSILGMDKAYIKRKFDEIVDFAEVERFIDTPVKRYSSGMYMRLAFAVAAHLEPDILVVDEVLAVGDSAFQKKCLEKMDGVAREGRTILFVSHNMQAISTLCSTGLLLQNGRVALASDAATVVDAYLRGGETESATVWKGQAGDQDVQLTMTEVVGGYGGVFRTDEDIRIRMVAEVLRPVYGLVSAVEIWSINQHMLAYSAHDDRQPPPAVEVLPGPFAWELVIPANTFASGDYEIRFDIGLHNRKRIVEGYGALRIRMENLSGIGRRFAPGWTSVFRPSWEWRRIEPSVVMEPVGAELAEQVPTG